MADTYKILGQQNPTANALTALYTVPGATSSTVSTLTVCNTTAAQIKFRISVAVAGAADVLQQYVFYDVAVDPKDTYLATLGITLGATDVVRCQTDTAGTAFNLFGLEVS